MKKSIKIDSIVSTAKCPCGKHTVSNYNAMIDFKETNNILNRCPECSLKYKVIHNPITKKMYFIDKETDKVVYTYVDFVKMTKISKASYDSGYQYSLEELDHLEEISKPGFEIKPVKIETSHIF